MESIKSDNCLVGFLDILGYREVIDQKSPEEILKAIELAFRAKSNLKQYTDLAEAIKTQLLSDSLLVVLNLNDLQHYDLNFKINRFCAMCVGFYHIIFSLLNKPVRGAIARGQYYCSAINENPSNQFLFSKAMVRAYTLENSVADVPRIVVDEELMQFFSESSDFKNTAVRDYDGVGILDTFNHYFVDGNHRKNCLEQLDGIISKEQNELIKRKYVYMKNSFNKVTL